MNDKSTTEIRQCDIDTTGPNSLGKLLLGKSVDEVNQIEEEHRVAGRQIKGGADHDDKK